MDAILLDAVMDVPINPNVESHYTAGEVGGQQATNQSPGRSHRSGLDFGTQSIPHA
ncbi:MAG: hypothetical protein OXC98_04450 [bacterium]|nr:hypothetical protein [Acidimicrobiia bacterium]MCY4649601.1 hypothetical protein [bacterium]